MSEKIKSPDLPKKTRELILSFIILMSLVACNSDSDNNNSNISSIKQTLTPTLDLSGDVGDAVENYNQEATAEIIANFYLGTKVNVIIDLEKEILLRAHPELSVDLDGTDLVDSINLANMLTFEHAADVFTVTDLFINKDDPVEWIVYVKISKDSANGWINAEQLTIIPELEWQISQEKSPFEKNTILIPTVDYLTVKAKPLDHDLELITTFGRIEDFGDGDFLFTTENDNTYIDPSGRKWLYVGFRIYRGYVPLDSVEADPRFEN